MNFFDVVRSSFGPLTQTNVDGLNTLLNEMQNVPMIQLSVKQKAYILATAWHETARTMQPVEEIGKGRGRPYGLATGPYNKVYYGRGYVQLTWYSNYVKATQRLRQLRLIPNELDLAATPEAALHPEIAAAILILGCLEGWFTGRKLADYVTTMSADYVNARRIVNGTDKAQIIASYADVFEKALVAGVPSQVTPAPAPAPAPTPAKPAEAVAQPVAPAPAAEKPKASLQIAMAIIAGLMAAATAFVSGIHH